MAKHLPPLTDAVGEVRELTRADAGRAMPFSQLPASVQHTLASRHRGPQKAPTKQQVTVRFSPEVLARFRASGQGWQSRMDAALQDWLKVHDPSELGH